MNADTEQEHHAVPMLWNLISQRTMPVVCSFQVMLRQDVWRWDPGQIHANQGTAQWVVLAWCRSFMRLGCR